MAIEIDEPTTAYECDQVKWYLLHEGVAVFIDHEDDWCIEFNAKCSQLGDNNLCKDYFNRPDICSDHGTDEDCEFIGQSELPYKIRFETAKEFDDYMKKKKIF